MKKHSIKRSSRHTKLGLGLGLTATLFALCAQSAQAATYYWDENGATAGFGTAGTTGTNWSSSTSLFSTSNTGVLAPSGSTATAHGDQATFGADSTGNGLGAGAINVSGSVDITTIRIGRGTGQGAITISGGAINFASSGTVIGAAAGVTINSALTGAGTTLNFNANNGAGSAINLGGGYTGGGTFNYSGTGPSVNLTAGTYTVAGTTTSGNSTARSLNLNGGTLVTAGNVFATGLATNVSFNGGTLRSNNAAGVTVFDADNSIVINAGGATFDTTVGNITIGGTNPALVVNAAAKLTFVGSSGRTFTANALSTPAAGGTPYGFNLSSVSINNATPLVSLTTFTETTDLGSGAYGNDFGGFNFNAAGTYNLIGFSSISGSFVAADFSAVNSTVGAGFTGGFDLDGTRLAYVVSAVPEPSTFAALAGLGAIAVAVGRRRRA